MCIIVLVFFRQTAVGFFVAFPDIIIVILLFSSFLCIYLPYHPPSALLLSFSDQVTCTCWSPLLLPNPLSWQWSYFTFLVSAVTTGYVLSTEDLEFPPCFLRHWPGAQQQI